MPLVADPEDLKLPNYYEAYPADFEAVESFIGQVSRQATFNDKACELARDFSDTLRNFRRIELHHTRTGNSSHREVLESLIAFARQFNSYLTNNPESDISSVLSREAVSANLAYLTDRWDIWYGPRDKEKADAFFKLLG